MKKTPVRACLHRFLLIILLGIGASPLFAQEYDEVFLQFNYQGGVNTNLIAYYNGTTGDFLLPVSELFRQLLIPHTLDANGGGIRGTFLNARQPYNIDVRNLQVSLAGKRTSITADQIYQGDLDLYMSQEVFLQVFELEFRVDFSNLMLRLVTPHKLPIVLRQERLRLRQRLENQKSANRGEYPLLYKRQPRLLNGGFLDYAYQQNQAKGTSMFSNLSLIGGSEILGGDVEFTSSVSNGTSGTNVNLNSWRWRYYRGDDRWVSQVYVGDVTPSNTTLKSAIKGARFTNDPLYPDQVFEYYTISELTLPEAEVELFINDRLTDFTTSDEQGRFTFTVPIVYGPNDIKVIIYGPGGQLIESNRTIRIPFNFVPKGQFRYDAGAGLDENNFLGGNDRFGYARGGYGLTRRITVGAITEYLQTPARNTSFTAATVNASLIEGLFVNSELAPGNFLKSDLYYQNARNDFMNVYYSDYSQNTAINTTGVQSQIGGALFYNLPFIEKVPLSIRSSYDRAQFESFAISSYSADLNTRLGKVTARGGFRRSERTTTSTGASVIQDRYQASLTYTLPRSQEIWLPVRGVFVRAQYDALRTIDTPDRFDLSLSRSFLRDGRIQMSATHIFPTKNTTFFFTISFDFKYVRTSANTRVSSQTWSTNQSIRGAVAYEPRYNLLWFDNRSQVGRSAVIADLYIDGNDNGIKDEGEESIKGNILRFQGAGSRYQSVKGYTIYTQMLQYRQYDVEINKAAVENPVLVAASEKFGIVTDPNQHKIVSVPFRTSGIFEGGATRQSTLGNIQALPGLRIYYENLETKERKELITFFDGSFYAMEVPPGDYRMYPDSTQLDILKSDSKPAYREFTIKSVPEGDFISGLNFDLKLRDEPLPLPVIRPVVPEPVVAKPQYFRIQTAMMSTLARAIMAKLDIEEKTGVTQEIQYNARWDNYRVFSTEIEGLENALAAINSLRRSQFSDAFIISEQIFATEDVFYAVQVGAFADSSSAVRHVADIKAKYDLVGHIQFDALSNRFQVVLEPMSNFLTASAERERVRSQTDLKDAFLITQPNVNSRDIEYSVQFGMFDTQAQAFQLSQRLTNRLRIANFVVQIGNRYYVRSRPTNALEDAVILYRRARSLGYDDAIIHTVRS